MSNGWVVFKDSQSRHSIENGRVSSRGELDWAGFFNDDARPRINFDLKFTFTFDSAVACSHFSHDGTRVAIGCNRESHIYDVLTGGKVATLSASSHLKAPDDKYDRSVEFSPDDRYLAIGSEDTIVRVSYLLLKITGTPAYFV